MDANFHQGVEDMDACIKKTTCDVLEFKRLSQEAFKKR